MKRLATTDLKSWALNVNKLRNKVGRFMLIPHNILFGGKKFHTFGLKNRGFRQHLEMSCFATHLLHSSYIGSINPILNSLIERVLFLLILSIIFKFQAHLVLTLKIEFTSFIVNIFLPVKQWHESSMQVLWSGCGYAFPELAEIDWILYHDKGPVHCSLIVQEFLAKNGIPTMPHPPYSPYIALCLFLIPQDEVVV